ncbi:hypothetical protein C8Q74DRAFT_1308228 [Fomes fomentarius]|nr:hypothetical protein C8Q74DRAFT_1308228 [Fomes fomentarius]
MRSNGQCRSRVRSTVLSLGLVSAVNLAPWAFNIKLDRPRSKDFVKREHPVSHISVWLHACVARCVQGMRSLETGRINRKDDDNRNMNLPPFKERRRIETST